MDTDNGPDLSTYDAVVVAFSGGKDSFACLLRLLELGVPRERIELWHHDVDGREGSRLMDWPCTRDYCRKAAQAFKVPIYFSWKEGGFEREMLRKETPTAPIWYESPTGLRQSGGRGERNTRRLFPQVSADLSVRWCSAYLKIDVGKAALRGQKRFRGKRTLFVTGERAEESAARAAYSVFEPHQADLREGCRYARHIDAWRLVHKWTEAEVWAIMERHRVNPHPAYRLGWGRVSCAACIFGNADQWASLRQINPAQFGGIAGYEEAFGKTIKRRLSVVETADRGTRYAMAEHDIRAALSETFAEPMILDRWTLPRGAFGDSCGPN
jgi:3'-phosphoadenosine 5'-phosphosulfate sulfotransferase (PAPS reductase)/FAD synthetase